MFTYVTQPFFGSQTHVNVNQNIVILYSRVSKEKGGNITNETEQQVTYSQL